MPQYYFNSGATILFQGGRRATWTPAPEPVARDCLQVLEEALMPEGPTDTAMAGQHVPGAIVCLLP